MSANHVALAVVAPGMATALGNSSPATCAAIRAGISGVEQGNIWDPVAGEYLNVGRPRRHQWWEGPDMLAELAAPAVLECLAALPQRVDRRTVPIFVLLSPVDRSGRESGLENILLSELPPRLGFDLPPGSGAFASGRTGILAAMQKAAQLFAGHSATHAVVVGVDTFLRQRVVEAYMEQRRVLTADNSNGFIPGEAACAVLLTPASHSGQGELRIMGWGRGKESGTIGSELPLTGDGMTGAVRDALTSAGVAMADTHYWLTDQNAEHYKAKECTITQIRLERRDRPAPAPYQIWHPIEFVGEIGSAIGPHLLGVCLAAAREGYAPGPLALLSVGEDNGDRAAFVLRWVPEE